MYPRSACRMIHSVLLILLLAALPTRAGTHNIWMDKFKPDWQPVNGTSTTRTIVQNPGELLNSGTDPNPDTVYFWAPVSLPVGSVITNVVYYHGGGPVGGYYTSCYLFRAKIGNSPTVMAFGTSMDQWPAKVTLTEIPENLRTVKPNYRYFLKIMLNAGTSIRGVQVFY